MRERTWIMGWRRFTAAASADSIHPQTSSRLLPLPLRLSQLCDIIRAAQWDPTRQLVIHLDAQRADAVALGVPVMNLKPGRCKSSHMAESNTRCEH